MESFFVHGHHAGEYALVTLGGELDIATAPRLRECLSDLQARGHTRLILDCGELEFVDASGISALVAALTRAQNRGGWVRLIRVQVRVHRVLDLVRLTDALPAFDSVQDALELRRHHDGPGRPTGTQPDPAELQSIHQLHPFPTRHSSDT